MSDSDEKSNPLAGIYGLGVMGFTALFYSHDGFWLAFGKSLIWPFYAFTAISNMMK